MLLCTTFAFKESSFQKSIDCKVCTANFGNIMKRSLSIASLTSNTFVIKPENHFSTNYPQIHMQDPKTPTSN